MVWQREDAAGTTLEVGDFFVGDTGRVYRLLAEQYASGDFLRVCYVTMRRGWLVFNEQDVHGQHGSGVIRITRAELEKLGLERAKLISFFKGRYPDRRAEISERRHRMQKLFEARRN